MGKRANLIGLGTPPAVATELTNGTFDDAGLTVTGNSTITGTLQVTGVLTAAAGVKTIQSVDNVHDTTPTAASLTSAFGSPATLGRGFVATVDDADGDTNGYLVWTSDASWYWLKGTKAL